MIGDRLLRLSKCNNGVEVTALDGGPMPDALEKTADYLCAGEDLHDFKQAFADDPCIGPAVRGYAGLRLLRQDPWECLVSFICSSTSNVPRIKLNVGAVAAAIGRRIGPSDADFEFPTPLAVAELGEQRLRDLGLGFRAKYLAIAAELVAGGDLDLMALRRQSYGDAKERLMGIHGVGEKIADCVLAFSLDKPEAFPVDRWTRRALRKVVRALSPAEQHCGRAVGQGPLRPVRRHCAAVHVPPRKAGRTGCLLGRRAQCTRAP